jgi:hypothetical protein
MSERPVPLPMSEYDAAREAYDGFCTTCKEITTCGVEPDARGYECECCGESTVYGIEEALLQELIEVFPE